MTKPKTGKAIMTEKEEDIVYKIYKAYLHGEYEEEEMVEIAFMKGIAQGRAEQDKRRDIPNKNRQSMAIYRAEKQAYAKGRDENKDKYFNAGIQKGQSDLKARLMSKEVIEIVELKQLKEKGFGRLPLAQDYIRWALAEATKEGGEK